MQCYLIFIGFNVKATNIWIGIWLFFRTPLVLLAMMGQQEIELHDDCHYMIVDAVTAQLLVQLLDLYP